MDKSLKNLLEHIVSNVNWHHRFLFTLSYLENSGARKIIKSMDPLQVSLAMLKHGNEESRHAYFFRKQIEKLRMDPNEIVPFLGGFKTKNYLRILDIEICRAFKKNYTSSKKELKNASYLLTTYIVEIRALKLFCLYQEVLKAQFSDINIQSIISEEESHLKDMEDDIHRNLKIKNLLSTALKLETIIYQDFINGLWQEIELGGTQIGHHHDKSNSKNDNGQEIKVIF